MSICEKPVYNQKPSTLKRLHHEEDNNNSDSVEEEIILSVEELQITVDCKTKKLKNTDNSKCVRIHEISECCPAKLSSDKLPKKIYEKLNNKVISTESLKLKDKESEIPKLTSEIEETLNLIYCKYVNSKFGDHHLHIKYDSKVLI